MTKRHRKNAEAERLLSATATAHLGYAEVEKSIARVCERLGGKGVDAEVRQINVASLTPACRRVTQGDPITKRRGVLSLIQSQSWTGSISFAD